MSKIREIHELLWNIQKGVSEKREQEEQTITKDIDNKEIKHLVQLKRESLEHTKGQLYEVNYILDNFWDIISK
jgi:hypothetical protein